MRPVEVPATITASTGKPNDGTCMWFLKCENAADGYVAHSVLGWVPTCQRCADKLALTLESA